MRAFPDDLDRGTVSNWYFGTASESLAAVTVNSRTMFEGTVTATDMDRATDAREKGRIGIFGTGNAYAGSSGRVTFERIGGDLNPLGRGDGNAFVGGAQNYGRIAPRLPKSLGVSGTGNSINNSGQCGTSGGCGGSSSSGFSTTGLGGSTGLTTQGSNCDWCCETFYDRNGRWEGDVPLDCYRCDCEAREPGTGGGGSGGGGGGGGGGTGNSNMDYLGKCGEASRCGQKCWSFRKYDFRPGGHFNVGKCSHVGGEACAPIDGGFSGCSFCWPDARQFCYACDVISGYDPCYCALHDCVLKCIWEKSGAQDLMDLFELSAECAELLADFFANNGGSDGSGDGMPCPNWESGQSGGGGTQEGGISSDGHDLADCLDELWRKSKSVLDRIKKGSNDPLKTLKELGLKFTACTMCCVSNYAVCLKIGESGTCHPAEAAMPGGRDNHWTGCNFGWL